jgi:peptidylprolyl isomerase
METVQDGLFISVAYKGTLANGDIFDSSEGRQPLEIQMGAGQLIKGFEAALAGMSLNEKKTFTLSPDEAYGHRNDEMMHTFSREEIPPEMNPEAGQTIVLTTPDNQQIPAQITEANEEKVVVDLNHPLAGESLTFAIEIVGISETQTQQPQGCDCGCDHTGCDTGDCAGGKCS